MSFRNSWIPRNLQTHFWIQKEPEFLVIVSPDKGGTMQGLRYSFFKIRADPKPAEYQQ